MPPKTHIQYAYEKYMIEGKPYKLPAGITFGSRRWKWWVKWQDLGLSLPTFEPAVNILAHGVTPFTPFEQYMSSAAA